LSKVRWQKERGTLAVTPFSHWRRNSSLSRLVVGDSQPKKTKNTF